MPTIGFFMSMPVCSSDKPDQSPQHFTFRIAVGKNETITASSNTSDVTAHLRRSNGASAKIRTTHGRRSGRLLAFAPVSNAMAMMEYHKSETRRDAQARQPKSIAASA